MTILLKVEKDATPLPAHLEAMQFTKWGYVTIRTTEHFIMLGAEARYLATLLRELASNLDLRTVADTVKSITPEEVISYFESSVSLQSHAADVRAALEPVIRAGRLTTLDQDLGKLRPHVKALFDDAGRPVRGYTRRAAAILFGDESANGGANLGRIKVAMAQLGQEIATTTARVRQNRPESDEKAA